MDLAEHSFHSGSFVADVGGYMGLLLGFSILSLYDEITALLKRLKRFLPMPLLLGRQNNGVKKSQEAV